MTIEEAVNDPRVIDRFRGWENGWYIQTVESGSAGQVAAENAADLLHPGFFGLLLSTQEWGDFESYTAYLLKVLGISTVHPYPRDAQQGRPDGFFKIGNLAVLYDCTLKPNYWPDKKSQIENYCSHLASGSVDVGNKAVERVSHCARRHGS